MEFKPVDRRSLEAWTHAEILEVISGEDGYCNEPGCQQRSPTRVQWSRRQNHARVHPQCDWQQRVHNVRVRVDMVPVPLQENFVIFDSVGFPDG
jgi:hypothetical protein